MKPQHAPRAAREADLDALAALEQACFLEPWKADLLARCFDAPHLLVRVVEHGAGSLCAAAIVQRAGPDEAELLRICCHPEQRRAGHARRLLQGLLDELVALGVGKLFLEVRRGNEPALSLYRDTFGFRQVGTRRNYYSDGSDALVLCREL